MAKTIRKKVPAVDPTSPPVTIQLGDREYKLTFDLVTLTAAEQMMREQGHTVNLLNALGDINLSTLPVLLTAAALHYQPDTKLEDIRAKITMSNLISAKEVLIYTWLMSIPEADRPKLEPGDDPAEDTKS